MALSLTAGQSGVGVIPVVHTLPQPLEQQSLPDSHVLLLASAQAASMIQAPLLSMSGQPNGGSMYGALMAGGVDTATKKKKKQSTMIQHKISTYLLE